MLAESAFWSLLEAAWSGEPEASEARRALTEGRATEVDHATLEECVPPMLGALQSLLDGLPAAELLQFDRYLEQKLYDLDREALHQMTGGSEEEFLAARCFVVALGHAYFDAVVANHARAPSGEGIDGLAYLATGIYEEKYGSFPTSELSRESGSNPAGWPLAGL